VVLLEVILGDEINDEVKMLLFPFLSPPLELRLLLCEFSLCCRVRKVLSSAQS
jgi:hypothetical protein